MQAQQAVLDFFAQAENLPLGLAVAELMDNTRMQLNRQFWEDLQTRLNLLVNQSLWRIALTEDRNVSGNYVGLHATPSCTAAQYLYPMLEQQNLGKGLRIYLALVWQASPTPEQLAMVSDLTASLDAQGFKQNERFLAWQWTNFHPQRSDFLLRYHQQPDALLDQVADLFTRLLAEPTLATANTALAPLPPSSVIGFQARA